MSHGIMAESRLRSNRNYFPVIQYNLSRGHASGSNEFPITRGIQADPEIPWLAPVSGVEVQNLDRITNRGTWHLSSTNQIPADELDPLRPVSDIKDMRPQISPVKGSTGLQSYPHSRILFASWEILWPQFDCSLPTSPTTPCPCSPGPPHALHPECYAGTVPGPISDPANLTVGHPKSIPHHSSLVSVPSCMI